MLNTPVICLRTPAILLLLGLAACSNIGDGNSTTDAPGTPDAKPDLQNPIWLQILGSDQNDYAHALALAPDGSLYVTGQTEGDYENLPNKGDTTDSNNNTDILLSKLNADGARMWHRTLGTSTNDLATCLVVDSDGSLVIGGGTLGKLGADPNLGGEDAFVARLDDAGNIIWATHIASRQGERVSDLTLDRFGNIYALGTSFGDIDGTTHTGTVDNPDFFISKISSDGVLLWTVNSGTSKAEFGNKIAINSKGNLVVIGTTQGNLHGNLNHDTSTDREKSTDIFLSTFDPDLRDFLWTLEIGSIRGDFAYALAIDNDDNIYIGGNIAVLLDGSRDPEDGMVGVAFIDKYDELGTLLWRDEIDQAASGSEFKALTITVEGNILAAGNTAGVTLEDLTTASTDIFIKQYNATGRTQRADLYGGNKIDTVADIISSADGSVYLAGSSNSEFPERPGLGKYEVLLMGIE